MFDPWLLKVISRHARRGVLVDANLLVIYCIGILDPSLISRFDGSYSAEDFDLLDTFLGRFQRIVTTPNIMTEASNLATNRRKDVGMQLHQLLRDRLLEVLHERYIATRRAAMVPECDRLGISDAATSILAQSKHLVLTNDFDLSVHLHSRKVDCINYTQILRPLILHPFGRRG